MLLQADAALIPLKDNSVHCVVTSPPYWGLRKYAGEQGRGEYPNLGLEPTPELHIQHIVEIFREVKRVLRDDGVVWLNYGDCYGGSNSPKTRSQKQNTNLGSVEESLGGNWTGNLMLMPHRVAIALQDDGWIVRNDLIWFKRNPMPESCAGWRFERSRTKIKAQPNRYPEYKGGQAIGNVQGAERAQYEYGEDYELRKGSWRHTRAHEYIFMLTKKMQYWCNQEAVREGYSRIWDDTNIGPDNLSATGAAAGQILGRKEMPHGGLADTLPKSGRNPRTVLDVPTSPYKGAHYATFPPNLIAPLIRASCPRRACPECGQGWAAVVEKGEVTGIPGEGGGRLRTCQISSRRRN